MNQSSTGDDLLKTFETLHIDLYGLSANVIRAWFDTDCPDMKSLLSWLCASLSVDNYLAPQESLEYQRITAPLKGTVLDKKISELDAGGLFDLDTNIRDLEWLVDQRDMLDRKLNHLDYCLAVNHDLSQNLSNDLFEMTQEHGELLRSFTKIASKCTTISTEIDETDCEIRTQLSDYINRFTGVEHAKILSFLTSSVDLNEFELAFQMIENYFNTTNGSVSTTILDIDDVRFTRDRNVVAVYKRVLAGRQLLLEYKTQLTELNAIHNYLEQFNFNDDVLLNNIQNGWKLLEHELDIKRKKKHHDLEIISQNFDCSSLSAVKLICADKLLTDYQVTFNHLNAIADQLINTRSYLIVIHRLYSIKSNDIRRCDQILKMLTIFLTENLETNHRRIEKMTKIINHYNTQTFDDKFKFIDNCAILLSNESSSLNEVLEQLLKLQTNIDDMEKLLFFTKINEASTNAKDFLNNINVLEKYLLNGSPTRQAIIISPNLLAALNETEMNFEQTTSQLKWAMQLSADALKKISHDKWFRYGRQLWMYFLHNPTKMTFIIEQIKTELERKQQQKQCFVVNQK